MYPSYPQTYKKEIKIADKTITIEIGKFSEQVAAAVLATCGQTVVHTTVALGKKVELGYFPLQVEYSEKLYAGGIIKGSRWVKREGRPTDDAVLKARVIDRSIRPLFPEGLKNEVQIINTVFSFDGDNDPDMVAMIATSVALAISPIPFQGPVAGLRVALASLTEESASSQAAKKEESAVEEESAKKEKSVAEKESTGTAESVKKASKKTSFLINPSIAEIEKSNLDLIVAGTKDSIVMVEAGANEVDEAVMIEAISDAQQKISQVCQQITALAKEVAKEKLDLIEAADPIKEAQTTAIQQYLHDHQQKKIKELVIKEGKLAGVETEIQALVAQVIQALQTQKPSSIIQDESKSFQGKEAADQQAVHEVAQVANQANVNQQSLNQASANQENIKPITEKQVIKVIYELMKAEGRRMILEDKIRPDGRKPDEIRPIWCEIDVFPRTHGSAMFKRGATQACSITTLGNPSLGWHVEDLEGEEVRHYMHHYNMPPYASGEAGRMGWPKRREIGHGALAERALLPMIPNQETFPYTIRVVSEILSSNGSTSQASVCGSTLSLMAAGVPIKKPVAGIAMGMMSDGQKQVILSDIQGLEDHVGDMDFKVAGTQDGITAIQMDIKLTGISAKILKEALAQAKKGRLAILTKMLACIDQPRAQISQYAPKVYQLTIPASRIGELIGPGGKVIKNIIEVTGAEVNVDEDEERKLGIVNISSEDQAKINQAVKFIEEMMRVVETGNEFDATVSRIEDYGVFVDLPGNKEGLVHVSEMALDYVSDPRQIVELGQKVHVRVIEVKDDGKISLSMLSSAEAEQQRARRAQREDNGGRGNSRSNGRNFKRPTKQFNGRDDGYNKGRPSFSRFSRGDKRNY